MVFDESSEPDAVPVSRAELVTLTARVAYLEREVEVLRHAATSAEPASVAAVEAVSAVPPPPPVSVQPYAAQDEPLHVLSAPSSMPQSFENRLGSQIFNRLGVLILLLGTAFFFKLAVDRGWISFTPVGRVIAGLVAGAAIVLWSESFRRKGFASFSYSLKALGSSVLYLTLWAAFHLFHLLPAPVALGLMIAVTAWNAWMALSQDSELLAGYALAGGFLTPALLATGGDHEVFLFLYLLALDLATVMLVRVKAWPRLLAGAFPLTMVYFIGWYSSYFHPEAMLRTTCFILLFGCVFSSVAIRRTRPAAGSDARFGALGRLLEDILVPLADAAFLALALYSVLQDSGHHDLLPWLMVVLAAVYLGLMRLPQSRTAAAIHLSIAIVLLTIAVPLKASGHWITAAWLVEGLVLLWISLRLTPASPARAPEDAYVSRALQGLASATLLLGFVGVLVHLLGSSFGSPRAITTDDLATALLGLATFAGVIAFGARGAKAHPTVTFWPSCGALTTIAFNVVAIVTGIRGIESIWTGSSATPDSGLQQSLAISAFLMVYAGVLLAVGFWRKSAFVRWQALLLLIVSILKAFLYDMRNLSQGYRVASFMGLGALLLAISFAYQRDWLALKEAGRGGEPALPEEPGSDFDPDSDFKERR